MKNLFIGLLALFVVTGYTQAQDADRALKRAGSALSAYNLDPTNNRAKLQEAVEEITTALADATVAGTHKAWQTKGEIFYEIANQIATVRQLGLGTTDDLPQVETPGLMAYEAFARALELSTKKFETKDALRGLQQSQTNLYNMGIYAYEDGEYERAYQDFQAVVAAHDLLKQNGETSNLDDPTTYSDQLYITGLAALNAERPDAAKPIFLRLYEAGTDKPAVYEALYTLESANDPDAAYVYLEQGRIKHPDDISLLFAEINHFLRAGKLDVLISKLESAIEKEPNNVSLYSTLGSVYDNLYQREFEAGNKDKANQYFTKSLDYYNQALAKDPGNFDATYSIGALYYNRAAVITKEQSLLGVSSAEQRRFDELAVQINADFEKALPFFQQCEQKNPNDLNTLIALKEIYARKNDFTTSNVFKTRLETVQGGGQNASSYFNN